MKHDTCKSDNIFPNLQSNVVFKDFWNLFFDDVYLKKKWIISRPVKKF